jgi:hypothetical protein
MVSIIMNRTFKKWESTIPPMSTNQTATSDHKSLNTTKIPTTYGVVNQGHGSGQA